MTGDEFRRLALTYPGAVETIDEGVSHFRVQGRAFARLRGGAKTQWADVKLSKRDWLRTWGEPELVAPLRGSWFEHGYTQICIAKLNPHSVKDTLDQAFAYATRKRRGWFGR
jgi:hypothetical protein